jgi:putative NAD(P)H nitroreductase
MDFFDLVKKRRACHHFEKNFQIPDEDLKQIIEIAGLTPSGYNAQPWKFVIVRQKSNIAQVAEIAFSQKHIANCSAVIFVLADSDFPKSVEEILADWLKFGYIKKEELPAYRNSIAKVRSKEKLQSMAMRSTMLCAMTVIFAAENLNYQTCPIMGFSNWQMREFLNLPENLEIALMIALGKSKNQDLIRLPRRSSEQNIIWEKHN